MAGSQANHQKVEQIGIYIHWFNQLLCRIFDTCKYISKHSLQIPQKQRIIFLFVGKKESATKYYTTKRIYTPRYREPIHARRRTNHHRHINTGITARIKCRIIPIQMAEPHR
jgi:hypothetical protein